MNFSKKTVISLIGALVASLAVAGIAIGSGSLPIIGGNGDSSGDVQSVAPAAEPVKEAFGVFDEAVDGAGLTAGQQTLVDQFGSSKGASAVRNADFSAAHAVSAPGLAKQAWIAPSGDEVCVYIPDPVDGYGASCATVDQVLAGEQIVAMPDVVGGKNRVIIAIPVVDGQAAPTIVRGDGASAPIEVRSNLAVYVGSADESVRTGDKTTPLSRFVPKKITFEKP